MKQKIHQLPSPIHQSVSWLCTQTSSWARDLLVKCSLKKNGALADGKRGMGELDGAAPCAAGAAVKGKGHVSLLSCWNWGDVGLQGEVQAVGGEMEENVLNHSLTRGRRWACCMWGRDKERAGSVARDVGGCALRVGLHKYSELKVFLRVSQSEMTVTES